MNRKYELVYIVSPEATDEQVADLHTQVEAIVQRLGGQLEKTENWGRRKLAYEIGRHKEGTYVLEVHQRHRRTDEGDRPPPEGVDLVIRHLVVRVDEEQAVIERTAAKRTATSQRRRVGARSAARSPARRRPARRRG